LPQLLQGEEVFFFENNLSDCNSFFMAKNIAVIIIVHAIMS